MPPRPEICDKVRKWAEYADEDLRLAEVAMTLSSGCPFRLVAYHAQQGAEKYLKAFLVWHNIDFPYTHNISVLLELCGEKDTGIGELEEAEILTDYAVAARYPDENEAITRSQAKKAIEIATRVRQAVREDLIGQGWLE